MAGFDDEVCEDFVEGGYCGGEGWGEVAEGYEEGADWEGGYVSLRCWLVVRVGFGDLRSSELKTWPFWRTRARGSAMVVARCVI